MAYRKFDTGTWQDPWFEDLSPQAKLLFIYLWSNDVCNQAGCYQISKRRIEFEVGFKINDIITELEKKVKWYPDDQVIWVFNFLRWQCQNPKFVIGAIKSINKMPDTIRTEFFLFNHKIFESYEIDNNLYHIDTVSIPYPNGTDTIPIPCPDSTDMVPLSVQYSTVQYSTETEADKNTCTELEKKSSVPDETIPIISIPLIHAKKSKAKEYHVTQNDVNEWQDTYPAVDVLQELKKIRQWNKDNPTRRKTISGIRKHISGWMAKEQDKGGSASRASPSKKSYDFHNEVQQVGKEFINDGAG